MNTQLIIMVPGHSIKNRYIAYLDVMSPLYSLVQDGRSHVHHLTTVIRLIKNESNLCLAGNNILKNVSHNRKSIHIESGSHIERRQPGSHVENWQPC